MTSQNQETDVFQILGELIKEQKKKHALPVSQKILSQSSQLDSDCSKNNDLEKKVALFSDIGLEIPNDPLMIKTYPNALRYIVSRICKDSSLLKKIVEMVKEQAKYEEKWWNDRQALIQKLNDKQKLNDMMAMQEMSKVQETELQRLGIPFFMSTDQTNLENKKKMIQLLKDLVSK
ncbi:hypothetical protein PCK2_000652 [Pneumocystis canis]|nr:hypothetical protein PCK2_000652 [Pneumocystis canis]